MYSIKSAVYTALIGTAISTYTTSIHYMHPQSFNTMPCISYKEIDNIPSLKMDDLEKGASIYFQIDIWSTGSSTSLALAVDTVMTTINFDRVSPGPELFDEKQQIYQKPLRYKIDYSDPDY